MKKFILPLALFALATAQSVKAGAPENEVLRQQINAAYNTATSEPSPNIVEAVLSATEEAVRTCDFEAFKKAFEPDTNKTILKKHGGDLAVQTMQRRPKDCVLSKDGGGYKIVEYLLKNGVDGDYRKKYEEEVSFMDMTLFGYAMKASYDATTLLLQYGADYTDASKPCGNTEYSLCFFGVDEKTQTLLKDLACVYGPEKFANKYYNYGLECQHHKIHDRNCPNGFYYDMRLDNCTYVAKQYNYVVKLGYGSKRKSKVKGLNWFQYL
jgi:hypothetical protein